VQLDLLVLLEQLALLALPVSLAQLALLELPVRPALLVLLESLALRDQLALLVLWD
jgi:hypothetical protein